MKKGKAVSKGGRPSKEDAGKVDDRILDAASALFFRDGYGIVSIEDIVREASISKRTFYARYENKEVIFRAVVHRVIERLRPPSPKATDQLFQGAKIEDILRRIASMIIHAAVMPDTLALMRTVISEAGRFPELAFIMLKEGGRKEAIDRIAELLKQDPSINTSKSGYAEFLAEQFLQMLTSVPQRRALGLGTPMKKAELDQWGEQTVDLFMSGICRN